jgi:hypothetical protein
MVQSGAPGTREPSPISLGWCPIVGQCLQSSPNLIEAQTHLLGNADEGDAAYDFAWVSALPAIRSICANQALSRSTSARKRRHQCVQLPVLSRSSPY